MGASGSFSAAGMAGAPLAGSGGAALVASGGAENAGEGGEGAGGADGVELEAVALLQRTGSFGFCIQEGVLVAAKLEVVDSGEVMLSGQLHRGWDTSSPGCETKRCELVDEVEPFALSGEQEAALRRSIAALLPPACVGVLSPACDPCLGVRLTIDGTVYQDPGCKFNGCEGYGEAFNAVTELIDSFAP